MNGIMAYPYSSIMTAMHGPFIVDMKASSWNATKMRKQREAQII